MTIRITVLAFVWAVFDPRVRRYILPMLAVSGLAVAITFSRGAMLAGLVALALVLVNAPARLRLIGAGSAAASRTLPPPLMLLMLHPFSLVPASSEPMSPSSLPSPVTPSW